VVLLALSAAAPAGSYGPPTSFVVPLGVAAVASFVVYRRFGFVYASVVAMACAAMALAELRLEQTTGFTAEKILERDSDWLRGISTASAGVAAAGGECAAVRTAAVSIRRRPLGGGGGGAQH